MMACLLAIELSEREMASKKNNPIKKMKFEGVSNPKREEIEYEHVTLRFLNPLVPVRKADDGDGQRHLDHIVQAGKPSDRRFPSLALAHGHGDFVYGQS